MDISHSGPALFVCAESGNRLDTVMSTHSCCYFIKSKEGLLCRMPQVDG